MAFQSASQQLMVPQNNVGQAFNQGASQADAAMVNDSNLLDAKRRRSMEDIGQLGSIGMALMGGRLDGQVDQQRLAELIPWAQAQGIDVSVLQNRPELIPLITRASLSSMQQIQTAQSEQEIDLRAKELQAKIAEMAQPKPASLPASYQEFLLAQQNPEYAAQLRSSSSRPQTDAVRRAGSLDSVARDEGALLLGDGTPQNPGIFDALSNGGDQIKDVDIFGAHPGRMFTGADYQRAKASLETVAQTYLYVMSGAAATASEVAKIVDSLTPKLGENPASVEEKKRRLVSYLDAISMAAQQNQPAGQNAPSQGAQPPSGDVVDFTDYFD